MAADAPLGIAQPFNKAPRPAHLWMQSWLSEEAIHFVDRVSGTGCPRLLTSRSTTINGPLALFYRTLAMRSIAARRRSRPVTRAVVRSTIPRVTRAARCGTVGIRQGPRPRRRPDDVPVFPKVLRLGRHAIYSAFLCRVRCRDREAGPSKEPDLRSAPAAAVTSRSATTAYFSRIQEQGWISPGRAPVTMQCGTDERGADVLRSRIHRRAAPPALRGAYAAPSRGPRSGGLAKEVTSSPEFAPCVVRNIARSFLGGRSTSDEP
jgi:hypothetical protein